MLFILCLQGSEYEQHQWDPAQSFPPAAPAIRAVSTSSFISHSVYEHPPSPHTWQESVISWNADSLVMRLMALACLSSPPLSNCLQQYARRSWDGHTKEGTKGNLIVTQRVNIWSFKNLQSGAQHPSCCFLPPPWLCFSWTARHKRHSRSHKCLPRQTHTMGGL